MVAKTGSFFGVSGGIEVIAYLDDGGFRKKRQLLLFTPSSSSPSLPLTSISNSANRHGN